LNREASKHNEILGISSSDVAAASSLLGYYAVVSEDSVKNLLKQSTSYLTLKMKVLQYFKTSVNIYKSTRRSIQADPTLQYWHVMILSCMAAVKNCGTG
jgi:hypothetical protein